MRFPDNLLRPPGAVEVAGDNRKNSQQEGI
jgi:hypothetical protein